VSEIKEQLEDPWVPQACSIWIGSDGSLSIEIVRAKGNYHKQRDIAMVNSGRWTSRCCCCHQSPFACCITTKEQHCFEMSPRGGLGNAPKSFFHVLKFDG
jgi:hypothetical protein